ncbi:MAG: DUF2281 domain-containing protein [Microcystis panniformis WG22]|uniref:DUF2281 domain-containing protein n=1 Tax=Microcystis aeruginosa Ma_MB_F_20061100_S20D TaxID=2486253 RepID=A0A552EE98_MICAE|nr:DUF2281 domain-containing protein [Microcystis panniformis WG22]TRU32810.1 MAG: DUF2281 domain-containing protein [Microcystis aeruginosa Ma_MB_F_20061100_S20D]TRU41858.1 MAG: DUF2281 domain-containing protein [Microcystis aeruginosa Ma_MB_F_20061100_S20]
MNVDTKILETVEAMPELLKIELLHYAEYLMANYQSDVIIEKPSFRKRRSGILQGTFTLPLSDDFDESLEDFQEYM